MAIETILAGLGGGIARLAPEVIKALDRRNERKHELALGEQQHRLIQLQGQTRLDEARLTTDASQYTASVEALRDVLTAQAKPTGIRWVDGLNASVRPVWTYLVLLMWATVKVVDGWVALARGTDWSQVRPFLWGPEDTAMLAMLGTFWFMDRVIKHAQGR